MRAQWPISILPRILAPAPIRTPRRILGWRSPASLPVPPSVTPCSIETSSSITAVSPTTRPVAWSRKMPRPICAAGLMSVWNTADDAALQVEGEIPAALAPQPVRQPMGLDGVEALEVEHRLEQAVGRGIAIDRRHDVGAEVGRSSADRRLVLERVGIGLPDQLGRHLGTVETLGDAVDDRRLQRVVMQDGRIDEGRELGLAARDLLGLAADLRPDRIDLVERAGRSRLLLGHDRLPERYPIDGRADLSTFPRGNRPYMAEAPPDQWLPDGPAFKAAARESSRPLA